MAEAPIQAAGGIVVQGGGSPLIAIVRLRKNKTWVLPKGKLKTHEDALAAAMREVQEETGHDVSVHEFLGTMSHQVRSGRQKIVQFWRMSAHGDQAHELMRDIQALQWLPLDQAVGKLTHQYEQAFLASVGPVALDAAGFGRAPVTIEPRDNSDDIALPPVRAPFNARVRAWFRRIVNP
jgi:8-oxo-dGTP diphosphatase